MNTGGERLPYPGLRSFTREETDLFFGREGCVDDMVDRLAATRFLAVLGPSGSGKSSLVKTGLLDALELGLLHQAGSRWQVADFRPGDRPLANLAEGLLRSQASNPAAPLDEEEVRLLRAFLARGPRSVAEWCADGNLSEGTNLLLLVDQFEELFRYGDYSEREEAEAFVGALLESAATLLEEARIYVVITMRSEYLGAAALIDGLAEAINRGLYLTPRMTRDEVREAIVGPAAVCGFEIEPALVNRLLNDLSSFAPWDEADAGHQLQRLGRRADQLPLMQHVLNRLWSVAAARAGGGKVALTLKDYDELGGLRGALAAHGREILDELLPEHRAVAPMVFRALTAGSSLAEAVRRPTEFGELEEIAGGEKVAVREVVEAFRAPGRNFLVPPRSVPLRANTLIDISHESLIRQWDEFAAWLRQEVESAEAWRRLVDHSERHRRGEADLLSGLTLASLANWWDTERPTAAWSTRYGGDFDRAASFLAESRKAEQQAKYAVARQERQRSRNRLFAWAAALIILIITPLSAFAVYQAWQQSEAAERARQAASVVEARVAEVESELVETQEARRTAEAQRVAADEARKTAEAEQEEAEAARRRAEAERQAAVADRQEAEAARALAERQRQAADEARQIAEEEQREAETARQLAEEQRRAAEEARQIAEVEQQEAETARSLAEAQMREALAARRTAETARQDALAALDEAQAKRQEAEEARRAAAMSLFRANLEQPAQRILSLQQDGSWDAAANLLGELWQDLIRSDGQRDRAAWFIDPIRTAYRRQAMATYPVFADFLSYSGLDGWTGTVGRFRVYALDRTGGDAGTGSSGNTIIAVFDVMTGAVTGSFELPAGSDLGSELDLVTPAGSRAAIVTDDGQVALWASDQPEPTFVPPPAPVDEIDLAQIAPVHSDDRFALYFTAGGEPSEIQIVDPATDAVAFSALVEDVAAAAGLEIESVTLLGFVGDDLYLLVNESGGGRIVFVDVAALEAGVWDETGGITSAAITPDGAILLTLTCHGVCAEQQLTAYDLRSGAPLWVETLPVDLKLSENAVHEAGTGGSSVYSVLAGNAGQGIVFRFPKDRPGEVERIDGTSALRVGDTTLDGQGNSKVVESADDEAGTVSAAGRLARFRVPSARQKLRLYVAPNSIAIHEDADTLRVAGVTYGGELLVYRLGRDGVLEEDVSFRPRIVGHSNCIAAVSFGGDGRSLLLRHIDGSLQYAAAVGNGTSIGWHVPDDAEPRVLTPSSPSTECDAPDATLQRIVAADREGRSFALLDADGGVWWVGLETPTAEASGDNRSSASSLAPSTDSSLGFAPLRAVAADASWITGDPARDRIAVVSSAGVDVVSHSVEGSSARTGGAGKDAAGGGGKDGGQGALRGEAKAAVFDAEGRLAVAGAGGKLSISRFEGGSWALDAQASISASPVAGLYARDGRIAVAREDDVVLTVDGSTGAILAYGRLPANPSAVALRSDGTILSLEWDTDAASILSLADMDDGSDIADAARLSAMRSLLDPEFDATIAALKRAREMEAQPDASQGTDAADCGLAASVMLARLERRLLGDSPSAEQPVSAAGCADRLTNDAILGAAAELADESARSAAAGIVGEPAFSRLLQAAADGGPHALRLVGAALTRIARARGSAGIRDIAADSVRFGASLPAALLKDVAAGGWIDPPLLAFARQRQAVDPVAHQLVAHALERRINDADALTEALLEFSLAERLYRETGDVAAARFAGHRRAQLARLLPDDRVLDVDARREAWTPEPMQIAGAIADVPEDPETRRARDRENAARLAEALPDSLLLAQLEVELERVRLIELAATDPERAVDSLLGLAAEEGISDRFWSADLAEGYLALAEEIGDSPESGFRLAMAVMRMIAVSFAEPIHANAEALGQFARAADLAAASAPGVPDERVSSATQDLEFAFLGYDYGSAPGSDDENRAESAIRVLDAAARFAAEVGPRTADPVRWATVRGDTLFWQGIVYNNLSRDAANRMFRASADALRPHVQADSGEVLARFRLAEALRWVGLTDASTEELAAVEREAIGHYAGLWEDRWLLADDLLENVGIGYGFALANVAQTMREINIADLADGRDAEAHAAWVLETLALAAEKDALNAEMIETGALSGDATFVDGWYRMSSYGIPIGFLSGLVNVENGGAAVSECDLLAADPYDPLRRAPGVFFANIETARAEPACREEALSAAGDARATYQLARSIKAGAGAEEEWLRLAREAAAAGVSPAFTLVADALDVSDQARGTQARLAASQHTIVESFPVLHPFLDARAATERERSGLAWYAQRAAVLGIPEAHVALAETAEAPKQKAFHLGVAARLWQEAGSAAAATRARLRAAAIDLGEADAGTVEAEVAAWTAEPLVELPDDVSDSS